MVAAPPGAAEHTYEFTGEDLFVVAGGEARSESVANALERVETDLVAIHDAARPLVTAALVDAVVQTLVEDRDADGAIAAAPVTDTIKRAAAEGTKPAFSLDTRENAGRIVRDTLDRRELWAVQTPQVFRVEALRRALDTDPEEVAEATDEAMLVEAAGGRVLIHASPAGEHQGDDPVRPPPRRDAPRRALSSAVARPARRRRRAGRRRGRRRS